MATSRSATPTSRARFVGAPPNHPANRPPSFFTTSGEHPSRSSTDGGHGRNRPPPPSAGETATTRPPSPSTIPAAAPADHLPVLPEDRATHLRRSSPTPAGEPLSRLPSLQPPSTSTTVGAPRCAADNIPNREPPERASRHLELRPHPSPPVPCPPTDIPMHRWAADPHVSPPRATCGPPRSHPRSRVPVLCHFVTALHQHPFDARLPSAALRNASLTRGRVSAHDHSRPPRSHSRHPELHAPELRPSSSSSRRKPTHDRPHTFFFPPLRRRRPRRPSPHRHPTAGPPALEHHRCAVAASTIAPPPPPQARLANHLLPPLDSDHALPTSLVCTSIPSSSLAAPTPLPTGHPLSATTPSFGHISASRELHTPAIDRHHPVSSIPPPQIPPAPRSLSPCAG